MKKTILLVMAIILIAVSVSCTYQGADNKKSLNPKEVSNNTATAPGSLPDLSDVKFEYFFRGFVTLNGNKKIENYPHDSWVIETDEDWHDFMDRYVPGIYYRTSVDYAKESLIFSPLFPAKEMFSQGADIKTFYVDDQKKLMPEYFENGDLDDIYAQNIDNILHCFVNIVKVNKKDIPAGVSNIYHKN
jgi:hypothetical protein